MHLIALHTASQTLKKPLQTEGVQWLFGVIAGGGGILADDPGMGKTLQVITLLEALVSAGLARRILVVTPSNLLSNWHAVLRRPDLAPRHCPRARRHPRHARRARPSHPIPSHPIPSRPVPSRPVPSHPIPSIQFADTQQPRLDKQSAATSTARKAQLTV